MGAKNRLGAPGAPLKDPEPHVAVPEAQGVAFGLKGAGFGVKGAGFGLKAAAFGSKNAGFGAGRAALFEVGLLDQLSMQHTWLHTRDPRAKLVVTLVFILTVVSFDSHTVAALVPLVVFPLATLIMGNLPLGYLARKVLLVSPFALCVGLFNPFFDTAPLLYMVTPWGGVSVSGGWLSFASIMLRFVLTVFAALMLVGTTGFTTLCAALERLGAPRVFVVQLLFLYRYLFVLTEEALRMARARNARSFNGRGTGLRVYGHMLGQLLLRALDRANVIHQAMVCRGFDGEIRLLRTLTLRRGDVAYMAGWLVFFGLARAFDLPSLLGEAFLQVV